jgi:hypothetical protein
MLIGRSQSLGHAHELVDRDIVDGGRTQGCRAGGDRGVHRGAFLWPGYFTEPVRQTFALIVHELSTNAAKYGALSSAGGEVVADWQLGGSGNGRYMEFSWREKGGPRVVPATHEGFGLSLITAMGSNGTSRPSIEFAPEGFAVRPQRAARDHCADPLRSRLANARRRLHAAAARVVSRPAS